jgi:hypothetical protein
MLPMDVRIEAVYQGLEYKRANAAAFNYQCLQIWHLIDDQNAPAPTGPMSAT